MITEKVLANLEQLKGKIPQWAKEAVKKNSGEIIDFVRFGQLAKGKNSFDMPLSWYDGNGFYAISTQAYADTQGVSVPKTAGSPYNFQWTGDTFDSMGLKISSDDEFDIYTIDGKQRMLENIYGEIFDLTQKHNDYVNEHIIEPYVADKLEENLFVF
jgi:hypothetical protein